MLIGNRWPSIDKELLMWALHRHNSPETGGFRTRWEKQSSCGEKRKLRGFVKSNKGKTRNQSNVWGFVTSLIISCSCFSLCCWAITPDWFITCVITLFPFLHYSNEYVNACKCCPNQMYGDLGGFSILLTRFLALSVGNRKPKHPRKLVKRGCVVSIRIRDSYLCKNRHCWLNPGIVSLVLRRQMKAAADRRSVWGHSGCVSITMRSTLGLQ